MAISYRVIQKPQPGVPGGGDMKWYASTALNGETDIKQLIKRIEKISTMSGGDIQGVIYSLVDVIIDELAAGNIVRLGELGDLRVSISSMGHESEDEVSANSIRRSRINFRPGTRLREMLNNLIYNRVE